MTEDYTRTPLAKRLGLKRGNVIILHNYPEHYFELFSDFPKSFQISGELRPRSADFIHLFLKWEEELTHILKAYCKALKRDAVLWISWPNEGYGAVTDLNAEMIWTFLSSKGLSHVGQLTIDGKWNTMGFRFTKHTKNKGLMKYSLGLLLILTCFTVLSVHGQNSDLLFFRANVIDVEKGRVLKNRYVTVDKGLIRYIGRKRPEGNFNKEIDVGNKFMMPGLINMYTHVNEDNLWLYLANGQTTVRDAPSHLSALGLRDKIEEGELIGPRIFAVGLRATGMPAPYPTQQPIRTSEEGIAQVREAKRLGYDGMFVYATCDADTYGPINMEAQRQDLDLSGHYPQNIALGSALNSFQSSFDNLTGLTRRGELRVDKDSLIQGLVVSRKAVIPTLTVHRLWSESNKRDSIWAKVPKEYIPNKMKANWLPIENGRGDYPYDKVADLVKEMYDRGVRIFLGSDGGYPLVIHGFSYHDEIANFSRLGIPNSAILKMATIQAASHLGYENLGLVKERYLADLLILEGNPLRDLDQLQHLNHVVVNGKIIERATIDDQLRLLRQRLVDNGSQFGNWKAILDQWPQDSVITYQMSNNELPVGEERLLIQHGPQGDFTLQSVNVMDGPDARETYLYAKVGGRKMDSLYVRSIANEGTYEVSVTTGKTKAIIEGWAPYHGSFQYEAPLETGTLLLGPFMSRYFEMDMVANYVLAMLLKRNLGTNQADQLPIVQVELNSEEYGENLIVDTSGYTILNVDNQQYKIIYEGMSGYRSITAPSNVIDVRMGEKGLPIEIRQLGKSIRRLSDGK